MGNSKVRRPLAVLAVALCAVLLPILAVVWVPVGMLVDAVRRRWRFPVVRLLAFATTWAWLEVLGVITAAGLFISGKTSRTDLYYKVQAWWCRNVVRSLARLVGLRFEVDGAENMGPGPFVLLARHVSLADAVMSSWVVGSLMKKNPRYVLKNELKMDPCLDIFGHRLPNYFIDRQSSDIASELQGIHQMGLNLGVDDVAVIFPEGSRANDKKRDARVQALKEKSSARVAQMQQLRFLIPPKPAGASALLQAVANAHVITLAHSGLEGLDSFGAILKNFGRHVVRVRVTLTKHDRSTVPSGEAFVGWLDEQWVKMDHIVQSHIPLTSQTGSYS